MQFRRTILSFFLVGILCHTISCQEQDSLSIMRLLTQAAQAESVAISKERYEQAYGYSKRIGFNQGILLAISNLVPIEIEQKNTGLALGYLLEELELLEKYQNTEQLILANTQVGDLYCGESLYAEAMPYYQKAVNLSQGSNKIEASLIEKLADNYAQLIIPDSAEIYYSKLLDLPKKEEVYRINVLRKLVESFQQTENYEKALMYNLQIKSIMESSSQWTSELGLIYNNLGYTHNFMAKYEEAITWFLLAEDYFQNTPAQLAILYTNLGVAHFNNGNINLAIQYLLKALSLTSDKNYEDKGHINNILANIYLQNNDFFNAQNFNNDAVEWADKSTNASLKSEVYATAAEIHTNLFEYEEAIADYQTHLSFRDSLKLLSQQEQQKLLQEKLNLGNTEKRIKLLLIKDQMKDLTIQKLESEKKSQQLAFDNLNLQAQKTEAELANRETTLKNQKLETKQAQQQLLLTQGQLELQRKEQRLVELAQAEALATAKAERNKALLAEEEQRALTLQKEKEFNALALESQQRTIAAAQRNNLLLLLISLLVLAGLIYTWQTNKKLGQQKLKIEAEQEKSERLLLNILPVSVAQELKEKGKAIPKRYNSVSILFSDFVDFTRISARSTPEQIIHELNECFMGFDAIMEAEGIEKIQTVGDGYLAVGGLPDETPDHAIRCVQAAKKMIAFLEKRNQHSAIQWKARIGIHSGPITAGVVGTKKFAYNIFGDTVNTASRIETAGAQGRINVSASTYHLIKDTFECEYRGKISAKGKGDLDMYFVQ